MGYEFFPMNQSNGLSSTSPSLVLELHSSAKWRAHLQASKESTKLIVIDFTASWCRPCGFIEPAINEFAAKYTDVKFIKIDVDELMDVAQEFEVQTLPTFVLIKEGVAVDKIVGVKKEELQNKIEKHMV
ncbi:thioredoxin H2-like [Cornus florida]|uniref:thioredoxin H2-like n=1 Tax=Cornus florida TaxID=4283 RepID=UPI00289F2DDB|nr:thioredoxin H2-like [Cornus florida]